MSFFPNLTTSISQEELAFASIFFIAVRIKSGTQYHLLVAYFETETNYGYQKIKEMEKSVLVSAVPVVDFTKTSFVKTAHL